MSKPMPLRLSKPALVGQYPRASKLFFAQSLFVVLFVNAAPPLALTTWYLSTFAFAPLTVATGLICGALYWSLFEYAMHRWLYHARGLPKALRPVTDSFHIYHHNNMRDQRVLNAGPGISYPILALLMTPVALAAGSGAFVSSVLLGLVLYYAFYECVHYAIHYDKWPGGYLAFVQKYHLYHHARRWNRNFGNTITLWDRLLGTYDGGYKTYEIDPPIIATFKRSQQPPRVPPTGETLKAFQKQAKGYPTGGVQRWRHNMLNILSLALLAATAVGVAIGAQFIGPWAWLVAPVAFGWLLVGLIALVPHECSHNIFLMGRTPEQTLALNRFFGHMICIPLGIDYKAEWEQGHRTHHAGR